MAETKTIEREYTIPLRRAWLRVSNYRRTGKAIKAIKIYVAKHMKVAERDVNNVKLDVYFNNDLWFRGRRHPPGKVKVKVKKVGEIVHVTFAEVPEIVKFLKARHEKRHEKPTKKADEKKEEKPETEEKTDEQKKEEQEKEQSVAEQNIKQAAQDVRAKKHITKAERKVHPQRMALKK